MNCNGCREALITLRRRATDCKGCTEQFIKNKMQLQLGNEVIVENVFRLNITDCKVINKIPNMSKKFSLSKTLLESN